jgi:hypothetical protein
MFGNTFGLGLLVEGADVVAIEEPVIQNCMDSQFSGRPKSALLAEKEYVQTVGLGGGGGGYFCHLLKCLSAMFTYSMLFCK